jgi:DNA-binding NtrC family response regulator
MLLVLSKAGVFRQALKPGARLTIGRGEQCEVRIEDAKASRRHVEIELGEVIRITDLGSRNGTLVGGRPLVANQPMPLRPGEPVTIGAAVLMVQAQSLAERSLPLLSEAEFGRRVEAAREEAQKTRGEFALAHVRFHSMGSSEDETAHGTTAGTDAMVATRLEMGLREGIRPADVLAYVGPAQYRVLFAATNAETAKHLAFNLRQSLDTHKVPADVGIAVFPRDGRTTDELAESARANLRGIDSATTPRPQLDRGALDRLAPLIGRVAQGNINVLIIGETGVGKEVLAHTVHERSGRAGAMVCLNCAALSEALLESELFGYERGAFTGAVQPKAGLLESADKGSIFLDEIGEMPLSFQAKLLRVIEQREVLRVGALRPRKIDVRFIAATNRDLQAEVAAGRFRQDLYFRLDGITLTIPPLRERVDEIEGLAKAFAQQAAEAIGYAAPPAFSEHVLAVLRDYHWPGNIRELKNIIERAALLCEGGTITVDHLPLDRMTKPLAPAAPLVPEHATRLEPRVGKRDENERAKIMAALKQCGGNQTEAAKILGVSRRTLVSRLGEYGIPRPRRQDD